MKEQHNFWEFLTRPTNDSWVHLAYISQRYLAKPALSELNWTEENGAEVAYNTQRTEQNWTELEFSPVQFDPFAYTGKALLELSNLI